MIIMSIRVKISSQNRSSGMNHDNLHPQLVWVCTAKIEKVSHTPSRQIIALMTQTPLTPQPLAAFAPIAAKASSLRPAKAKITQKPSQNCRN